MKSFEELDANKDGKLSLDEFVKVAEPPYSHDVPNGPNLEERRNRAKAEFGNLDTNRDSFVERGEAEALVHSEFNQYDTDRDNKVTEPEVRLIVQRVLAREQTERQQAEQRRRQGLAAVNDFIDMQLREADRLDKNNDVKISQQEYATVAGPADGPQAQGLLPYDIRRQLVLRKFNEIDTNKDGVLDRVELTASAVKLFVDMDANKDRFLNEEEFKKAQENETKKMRAIIQAMQPAQPAPAAQRPAPAPAQRRPLQPQQGPPGLAPGLPQGTR
jgi:Ca2+-binding EF-hand superfamily protein